MFSLISFLLYIQVVCQQVLFGKSSHDIKRPLQKLQDRYGRYKFDPVLYVTTDECCTSADLLRGIFGNGLLIMLDIFHFMQRIADSTYGITHPAFLEFMQRLRQAIFVCYPEDKQQVRRLAGPNRNSFSH